ncbi:MAG TPA: nitroreductase [Cellvibrio sp.]|nr:nitroreductase [Cellvibrio sp.]
MNPLSILQARVSVSKLQSPAPTFTVLQEVFKAASRAADHGLLRPWRFLVIEGEGLAALSQVFAAAAVKSNPEVSPSVVEKCRNMPNRAPMIIVAIASCQPHPKVPRQEQVIACGAAVQNMLNAFFAMGFGAIWRSGDMARDEYVNEALGLLADEEIIGFIYVGTPVQPFASPPDTDINGIFQAWPDK